MIFGDQEGSFTSKTKEASWLLPHFPNLEIVHNLKMESICLPTAPFEGNSSL